MKRFAVLSLTLAATAAVAVPLTLAGTGAGRTLEFVSVQRQFVLQGISQTAPPQIGGRLIFDDVLYNHLPQFGKPVGARVGSAEGVCTIVSKGTAQCIITAHDPDGEIVVAGAMILRQGPGTNRFAILGGAGAYGNAHGTVTGKDINETKTLIVAHLSS